MIYVILNLQGINNFAEGSKILLDLKIILEP